jgi:hypothetical protein
MSYWNNKSTDFESLVGMTFVKITGDEGSDRIVFVRDDGVEFVMYHHQDCCENVYVESIVGDLHDLLDSPIVRAEEATNDDESAYECGMWTFYKLATKNGYVDIRWYGSSNGYYGVGVSFEEVVNDE